MNSKEELLWRYTDLTWAQYYDLRDLWTGEKQKINGARHYAMRDLITDKFEITQHGNDVLKLADQIMTDKWKPAHRTKTIQYHGRAAIWIKKKNPIYRWILSVHVKVLGTLYEYPDQSYRQLVSVYGYQPLDELHKHQLIDGEHIMGARYKLTPEGIDLVEFILQKDEVEKLTGWA